MKKNKSTSSLNNHYFNISLVTGKKNEKNKYDYQKIKKGAVYTAYNRRTFGSIPSPIENIIFKSDTKPHLINKSRNENANKDLNFKVEGENIRFTLSNNLSKSRSSSSILINKSPITKKEKKYFGGDKRFDNWKEEISKYSPGPGEYNPNTINKPSNYKYKSLFKQKKNESLIPKNEDSLGPGTYNPKYIKDTCKSVIFLKDKKFSNFNTPFPISQYNSVLSQEYINYPSSFTIKRKKYPSYFFMKEKNNICSSSDDLFFSLTGINSPTTTNNQIDTIIPKKKVNESKPVWIKEEIRKRITEINQKEKESIDWEQKELNRKKELLQYQKTILNYAIYTPQSKRGFHFDVSPKMEIFNKNHVPGPSYYDHNNIMKHLKNKKFFHTNDNIWI